MIIVKLMNESERQKRGIIYSSPKQGMEMLKRATLYRLCKCNYKFVWSFNNPGLRISADPKTLPGCLVEELSAACWWRVQQHDGQLLRRLTIMIQLISWETWEKLIYHWDL